MKNDEEIYQRTMRLRIVRERDWISDEQCRMVDTLQQLWLCSDSGGFYLEDWRDVEVVEQ